MNEWVGKYVPYNPNGEVPTVLIGKVKVSVLGLHLKRMGLKMGESFLATEEWKKQHPDDPYDDVEYTHTMRLEQDEKPIEGKRSAQLFGRYD